MSSGPEQWPLTIDEAQHWGDRRQRIGATLAQGSHHRVDLPAQPVSERRAIPLADVEPMVRAEEVAAVSDLAQPLVVCQPVVTHEDEVSTRYTTSRSIG